jgi:hypothetical protein
VFQTGNGTKPHAFAKTKQDCELEVAKCDKQFVGEIEKAKAAEAI